MRIGVFGGTFDPIHMGHLILAEQCREQAHLERVHFIPAARPPHKQDQPITSFAHRAEMLRLAIAGHPAFLVNEMERERPGPSYTVDTLESLRGQEPNAHLVLMLGSDCLPDLVHWRQPERIGELAELLVMLRPGWPLDVRPAPEGPLPKSLTVRQLVEVPLIDIASRDLRRRASQGRSLRFLVPRAVECYIETHGVYRGT